MQEKQWTLTSKDHIIVDDDDENDNEQHDDDVATVFDHRSSNSTSHHDKYEQDEQTMKASSTIKAANKTVKTARDAMMEPKMQQADERGQLFK
jgi:hypothetical protein